MTMKFKNIFYVLSNITISRFFVVVYILFILPVIMGFSIILAKIYIKFHILFFPLYLRGKLIRSLNKNKEKILEQSQKGYRITLIELGLDQKQIDALHLRQKTNQTALIAEIDQDGYFLSHIGTLPGLPTIEKEFFIPRKKFRLTIIAQGDFVAVQKNYEYNRTAFANELNALVKLNRIGANVPSIFEFDTSNYLITYSYIFGNVLREELVKKGARIRDRDIALDPKKKQRSGTELRVQRIHEGNKVLFAVVDQHFIDRIYEQISKIQSCGLVNNDIKYGNIIIDKKSLMPYIIDFESALDFSNIPDMITRIIKDIDIDHLNEHFSGTYFTYHSIKNQLKNNPILKKSYAPVHFGYGLKLGLIWNIDSGDGRWERILQKIFSDINIKGMRILDLGANNAYNGIQFLRNGAIEVTGIEVNDHFIEQGKFLISAFEWADEKKYHFKYLKENFLNLPNLILGKFDMVTALCCLYYLNDKEMEQVVAYISTITDIFIVQCNLEKNIGRLDPHTYEKASTEYTIALLKRCGFVNIKIIAPKNYSKPVIIAKKNDLNF